MSHKRSYEDPAKDFASPTKRTKHECPQTPTGSRGGQGGSWSSSSGHASRASFATPATPYTPYPLQPSDSPSNPFKRRKKVNVLPPISSYSKHVALRFQFNRRGISPIKGGVHRIVQVPLNYTFAHFRALISWLFDTPAKVANGKAREEDYLFEVKSKVVMESMLFRPGIIRSGSTTVKVSNVRDPWHARYGREGDDEDELTEEDGDASESDAADGESEDWVWADEEDHTLGHVWITGVKADKGIIYHHSPTTQIHITPNATKLPRRRGKSNVPYIFSGRGRMHLSPPPLPRPLFSRSIIHTLSSSPAARSTRANIGSSPTKRSLSREPQEELSDTDAAGDSDQDEERSNQFDESHPFFQSPRKRKAPTEPEIILVEDSDEEGTDAEEEEERPEDDEEEEDETVEDPNIRLNPDKLNSSHYAFGRYLLAFFDPKGSSFDHLGDEYFEEKKVYDPFDNDDDDDEEEESYVEEDSMHHPLQDDDEDEEDEQPGITPGLTSTSPHTSSSSLPPSSPAKMPLSSSPGWYLALSSESSQQSDLSALPFLDPLSPSSHSSIIASHYPNRKYTVTPAPPKARKHRLRIKRLERRLEKVKKEKYLCEADEDEEEKARARAKAKANAKGAEEEVDELEEDDDDDDTEFVRPILKEGEIWDPFGDEEEL